MSQGLIDVAFVLSLFSCVVLHELGHALAARVFGIPTHGITLLPIGGLAQLDRIPRDPWQEWVIALAGPAVNVMIVGLLFPTVVMLHGVSNWASPLAFGESFLTRLMWMNVMLVAFNLIPAFPMDGGRVLRSILAQRTDYVTATRTAKRVGQCVAVVLAVLGLWTNPMLLVIAAFVIYAAETEYRAVVQEGPSSPAWQSVVPAHFAGTPLAWPSAVTSYAPVPSAETSISRGPSTPSTYSQRFSNGVILVRTFPGHHHRWQQER